MLFNMLKFRNKYNLRIRDLERITGVTRQSLYTFQKTGNIPLSVFTAIEEWIEIQERKISYLSDKEFLEFIYFRMVNVFNENPNKDYMIKFKEIINKTK